MRLASLLLCAVVPLAAQLPKFTDARVQTAAFSGDLAAQLRSAEAQPGPRWWGYQVPGIPGHRDGCGVAYLDSGNVVENGQDEATPSVSRPLVILFRLDQGQVAKVRSFDLACEIEAEGATVAWLSGVPADASVGVLASLVEGGKSTAHGALGALAETDGTAAEAALERFLAPAYPDAVRKQAVFWLGSTRGHAGFLAVQKLAQSSSASDDLRKQATFALSTSRDPGAADELIRMAKLDPSISVREQALFWLAQKASKKAIGAISDAIQNDPATAVKERAVFGLTQVPNGEGVPLLIQVAQTNSNPAVRKKAMFWLGQSKDPRAVAFFAGILEH